jgi:hypothetical protein
MTGDLTASIEVAPSELGESLSAVRLCAPEAQQQMRLSLSRLGQVTPVQAYRMGSDLEIFDGIKRARAARALSWPTMRVEVHALDAPGAKVRLLRCNESCGLSELEEAWLVRSLYPYLSGCLPNLMLTSPGESTPQSRVSRRLAVSHVRPIEARNGRSSSGRTAG